MPRRRRHDVVVLELSSNVDPKPLSATERTELAKRAADLARAIESRVESSPIPPGRPLVDLEADYLLAERKRQEQRTKSQRAVAARVAKAKALDKQIRAEHAEWRARHEYDRAHSTRWLAGELAKKLPSTPGTIRRRLSDLGLR